MNAVEKWKRMSNPQTVEDYGLSVSLEELAQTEEGRQIIERDVNHWLPSPFAAPQSISPTQSTKEK